MLINYLNNASFVLITNVTYIYNKRTNYNVSIFKTHLYAIKESYLKHLFLANKHVNNSILKDN